MPLSFFYVQKSRESPQFLTEFGRIFLFCQCKIFNDVVELRIVSKVTQKSHVNQILFLSSTGGSSKMYTFLKTNSKAVSYTLVC